MTAEPKAPGAAAVYLYREETTIDADHTYSIYVRLKVLTEKGKDYANVSVQYGSQSDGFSYSIESLAGRTVHSDGTVIPFTGKPYQRLIEKTHGSKTMEKAFTLPSVEVGSILEYRYKLHFGGNWLVAPTWTVQQDLFMRKGYFLWKATVERVSDSASHKLSKGISWTHTLPEGIEVKRATSKGSFDEESNNFELTVNDIAPQPEEDFMPPVQSFIYSVHFYYAIYNYKEEFWAASGMAWAAELEKFMAPPDKMTPVVQTLVSPGDTDREKLRKIYAAVMMLDNTRFSRTHESNEDRAAGLKEIKTTLDIWNRKSGTDDQLTDLFVSLARAAGMKALVMKVTSRQSKIFSPSLLSMDQLDDNIAIVTLDGKEEYFDPGQRDCPFGQLAWMHTDVNGLREMGDRTTAIAGVPPPLYTQSQTQRIADLTMDATGSVQGTIKITWMGSPALEWRQQAIREDEEAMKHSMQKWLEERTPDGLSAEITGVEDLEEYEKPLTVKFAVHGPLAVVTAKRFILPGEFFEVKSKPLFPAPTRDIPIYFHYAGRTWDAVRVKLPAGLTVESTPKPDRKVLPKLAGYEVKTDLRPGSVRIDRVYDRATTFIETKDYADVRTFYNTLATADQQPIVLLATGQTAAPAQPETAKPD